MLEGQMSRGMPLHLTLFAHRNRWLLLSFCGVGTNQRQNVQYVRSRAHTLRA